MLASLSIRDIVLIERLDLSFSRGLAALTGETGAGKSILLDALGLALGNRAETKLLRPDTQQASVAAGFEVNADNPLIAMLEDEGFDLSDVRAGDLLILRRSLSDDGRSRAFVNGQPLTASQLRRLADHLIEVQGQFEQRGLLNPATHRTQLDTFAQLDANRTALAKQWHAWQDAERSLAQAETRRQEALRDEAFLRHSLGELEVLAPEAGEASSLAERRALLKNSDRLIAALNEAEVGLAGNETRSPNVLDLLSTVQVTLEESQGALGGRFAPALEALARAEAEAQEGLSLLHGLLADFEAPEETLEDVEERYFALNDLGRKHNCDPDELAALQISFEERLAALDSDGSALARLQEETAKARADYVSDAEALSKSRQKASKQLDKAIMAELEPLRLGRARFETQIEPLAEERWGADGIDSVQFLIATNPGHPSGPLAKIASGGELSRFLLALKVVLAANNPGQTLIFDEVDSGIGGATADAVGERLARLSKDRQVLVVTHSPQVAARAGQHCRVRKTSGNGATATLVETLDNDERREEIARMLSGAEVTEEARAAASRLMGS